MVEVRRREKESVGSLMRRFSYKVQRSKILIKKRGTQFRSRPKSKLRVRKEALKRALWKKEFDRRKKLGKVGSFKI